MSKKEVAFPRYQQIAVAIAERIVDGKYPIGSKIYARSTLASNFNVSPETARKAINVLVDRKSWKSAMAAGHSFPPRKKPSSFLRPIKMSTLCRTSKQAPPEHPTPEEEFANFSQLLNQLLSRTKDVQQRFPLIPTSSSSQQTPST